MILDDAFITAFKLQTEAKWQTIELEDDIFGFQTQKGTVWRPGLSSQEIASYEKEIGGRFPDDLRLFLSQCNGFDTPGLNIYGHSGEPYRTRPIAFSYPDDLEQIREWSKWLQQDWKEVAPKLEKSLGFKLPESIKLVPFFHGNFVLCLPDPKQSPVFFIQESFVAKQADNLRDFLQKEFLEEQSS